MVRGDDTAAAKERRYSLGVVDIVLSMDELKGVVALGSSFRVAPVGFARFHRTRGLLAATDISSQPLCEQAKSKIS